MVEVTKTETQRLKTLATAFRTSKTRTSNQRISPDAFAEEQLQHYGEQLLAVESEQLDSRDFSITVPNVNWDNDPDVTQGDPATLMSAPMQEVFERTETAIIAITENPIYEQQANLSGAMQDIERAIEQERNAIDQIPTLSQVDKDVMKAALEGARDIAAPQAGYFTALAEASVVVGGDPNVTWRLGAFLKKALIAAARAALITASVVVATAIIIKTGGAAAVLLAKAQGATSIFAMKIKGASIGNWANLGLWGVKTKVITPLGATLGGAYVPGGLAIGGIYGGISGVSYWNDPLFKKGFWSEFRVYTKIYP